MTHYDTPDLHNVVSLDYRASDGDGVDYVNLRDGTVILVSRDDDSGVYAISIMGANGEPITLLDFDGITLYVSEPS